jgi:polysaccharide export outer membrane protein
MMSPIPGPVPEMKSFNRTPRRRLRAFLSATTGVALTCLVLSSCAPGSGLPSLPTTQAGPYRLGVGEEVRIITFGEERLTGQFKVNDRGEIAIPLLGTIPASGLTTTELEKSISKELVTKKVLLDPSVSVEVLNYRPVFILGEVSKPGQYPYQPGMTVLTAVAIAGGFTYRAETDYASILRNTGSHPVEGRAPRGTEIRPGDVIDIYERYF